jgi:2-polyprenyl-3-methyl-5-hydroxy-6-metoxy-1,4-benzoquinol methylase
MKAVDVCPACGGRSFRPFSLTVDAERGRDMHFAQTRCRDCDLVFSNPVADPDELEHFYTSSYYEDHEVEFNPARPDLEAIVRARGIVEADGLRRSVLPYTSGGRFFEIGAGFGGMLDGARRLGFDVAGVELSEQAARFGRDVMGLADLRHGVFDARQWPPASFDVVYSYMVIEHVSDLHQFANDIHTMLKPGGIAVIGTENHHNAWVMTRRVRSWLKGRRLPEFQTASHHTFYFSATSLSRLMEEHKLPVFRCLVYTPSLAEKRPHYQFRWWLPRLAFYLLHYADVWTGRGGRVIVWCRKPA